MTPMVKRRDRDTMSISKMTWISAVAPGYGQIHNKQYWKLPILYGTLGATLTISIQQNNKYQKYQKQVKAITDIDMTRTPELNALQSKMIKHNTARQVLFFGAIASYIYFVGEAAVNYRGSEVSPVKQETTQ